MSDKFPQLVRSEQSIVTPKEGAVKMIDFVDPWADNLVGLWQEFSESPVSVNVRFFETAFKNLPKKLMGDKINEYFGLLGECVQAFWSPKTTYEIVDLIRRQCLKDVTVLDNTFRDAVTYNFLDGFTDGVRAGFECADMCFDEILKFSMKNLLGRRLMIGKISNVGFAIGAWMKQKMNGEKCIELTSLVSLLKEFCIADYALPDDTVTLLMDAMEEAIKSKTTQSIAVGLPVASSKEIVNTLATLARLLGMAYGGELKVRVSIADNLDFSVVAG